MLPGILAISVLMSCGDKKESTNMKEVPSESAEATQVKSGSYAADLQFFRDENIKFIDLNNGDARVLVVPAYQGRVMTSTAQGKEGTSFGWINYDLISSGEWNDQFNPVGGEERIWLGPEGGPYSIYFAPGEEQDFTNWNVPAAIDSEPFDVVSSDSTTAVFKREFSLTNASGFDMEVKIDRAVRLLSTQEASDALDQKFDDGLKMVAYESENTLTNTGTEKWEQGKGVLSIWLLSMFNPSAHGTVFIPYQEGPENELGKLVTDDYFGKVPDDRLKARDGILYFKTDGKQRGKIGLSPDRAKSYCGSYDPDKKILTLLWFSKPSGKHSYVNSKWGEQDDPLAGDALNSYNDGPVEDGSIMGPFYEIESSSPAAMLAPGQSITHTQRIFHISGDEAALSNITRHLFGISISDISSAF